MSISTTCEVKSRGGEEGDRRERGEVIQVEPRYQISWKLLIMTTSSHWEEDNFGSGPPHHLAAEQAKAM